MKALHHLYLFPIAASLALFAGCSKHEAGNGPAASTDEVAPIAVQTLSLHREEMPRLCELPGTVTPKDFSVVSARVMGTVSVADFAIGQHVDKGQELVLLYAPEMAARVDQAQAALDKAKRDYARESALLKNGASTAETVNDLAERQRMAEAALLEAQSLNSYTKVSAPFSGNITRKMVSVGDFAAPGTPLFEIAGEGALRVEVSIPDSFPVLKLGTSLDVNAGAKTYSATLAESSFAADPRTRTRLAKLDLTSEATLRSGQFVRVYWKVGQMGELAVPRSALSRFGQLERAFIVRDGRAALCIVKTGESYGDKVQVLSGLSEGDVLILNPGANLSNGSPVEVR